MFYACLCLNHGTLISEKLEGEKDLVVFFFFQDKLKLKLFPLFLSIIEKQRSQAINHNLTQHVLFIVTGHREGQSPSGY